MSDRKVNLLLKLEADRVESADYVLWAMKTYDETLVERLDSRSDPAVSSTPAEPGGRTAPRVMVDWYQEQVTRVRSRLLTQSRIYRTAKTQRSSCWRGLRKTARTVGTAVAGIRDQFFSTYGEDFSVRLGFARQTPRRDVELLEYVEYLVESLSRPGVSMPEPAPGRLPIDVAAQLALLVPLCESLKDARNGYHVARREAQEALVVRNEAVEAFDADFPWLAGGFESQLRMAGLKPLAAAVRPSSRRKGLIALVAGEAPEPEELEAEETDSGAEPSSASVEKGSSAEPTLRAEAAEVHLSAPFKQRLDDGASDSPAAAGEEGDLLGSALVRVDASCRRRNPAMIGLRRYHEDA